MLASIPATSTRRPPRPARRGGTAASTRRARPRGRSISMSREAALVEVAAERRRSTAGGSWSGTSRMSSRACASAGRHGLGRRVRVPRPQPLEVERRVENVSASTARRSPSMPAVEALDLPVLADVVEHREVLGGDDRELVLGRRARARRPGRRRPAAARRPRAWRGPATSRWPALGSTTDRLEWASWAIVLATSSRTTMPLPPPWTAGRPARSSSPPSMSAASASRRSGRRSSSASRCARARLLLALDEVPDAAGERPERLDPRLERPDARQQLALVVGRAAGPDPVVADRGVVRRVRPQVERRGGLDVVVPDAARACAAPRPARRRRAAARPRPARGPRPRSPARRSRSAVQSAAAGGCRGRRPRTGCGRTSSELLRSSPRGARR